MRSRCAEEAVKHIGRRVDEMSRGSQVAPSEHLSCSLSLTLSLSHTHTLTLSLSLSLSFSLSRHLRKNIPYTICKSDSSEKGFEVRGNQKATVDVSDVTQIVLVLLACYHLM